VEGITYIKQRVNVIDWTGSGILKFRVDSDFMTSSIGFLNGFQIVQVGTVPQPLPYCTGGTSVGGCSASLSWSGDPSSSAISGFTISMVGADAQRAVVMAYSMAPSNTPFSFGSTSRQCLAAPRQRLIRPPDSTGGTPGLCNGQVTIDLQLALGALSGPPLGPMFPGVSLYVQGWYRDSGNGSSGVASSDGLCVTLTP
jgi:hypothetical protein